MPLRRARRPNGSRLERGARAARAAARTRSRRSLRPAAAAARRAPAAGAGLRPSRLPARLSRRRGAGRRVPALYAARPRRARPTAAGGCSPTARRRRRAPATRSRTASSSRALLPDAFRELPRAAARRVLPDASRDAPRAGARATARHPRIVLLTPGPYNETYFEHAYLARYLGYTLVEGGDLTVRDERVYLKTLGGLEPVDVILRRLDDDFCDPLELRADSSLGVPGLVQAVRAGNVLVANALGSGVLETPALLAFLPALCRAPARRGARAAVGRDLVVRRRRPRSTTLGAACRAGHQAGVPRRAHRARLRGRSRRGRPRPVDRAPGRGARPLRARRRRPALARAGLDGGRHRAAR